MTTTVRTDGVLFNDGSLQTTAGGVTAVIKLDVNFNTTRTGTLSRFGTVNYYDLSISGISDYTKCVIHPLEITSQNLLGITMSISNVVFGGSMELVSNSVLRFYFKSTYSTNTTAQGRLQIIQYK